jgi:hypothetical protein
MQRVARHLVLDTARPAGKGGGIAQVDFERIERGEIADDGAHLGMQVEPPRHHIGQHEVAAVGPGRNHFGIDGENGVGGRHAAARRVGLEGVPVGGRQETLAPLQARTAAPLEAGAQRQRRRFRHQRQPLFPITLRRLALS